LAKRAVASPRVLAFVRRVCERLGRTTIAPMDMIEELAHLPSVPPLPEVAPEIAARATTASGPAHDYAFWERQWERYSTSNNLIALRDIADEAPRLFANQARARIAEIGRIVIDAKFIHGDSEAARAGWLKPGAGKAERFKDLDAGPEMVVVPAGEFLMGSPDEEAYGGEAQHGVRIAKPFAVGRFAVTLGEFAAFVEATGRAMSDKLWTREEGEWEERKGRSYRNLGFAQSSRHPVVGVSWEDSKGYVDWLAKRTGRPYRLLSEAEWEYAARAGTTTPFWWG